MTDTPKKSVTYQPRQINHTFHLIMTIVTVGMWGMFVWLPLILLKPMLGKKKIVTTYE